MEKQPFVVKRLGQTPPVDCPCGESRRLVTAADNGLASIHRVSIHAEAKKHYHKKATEFYYILSGSGEIELDDERIPVEPGDVVMIPPYTRHVARGQFEIVNVICPPFDAADEFFDEPEP
ncbi:MAG: hypothetical protein QG656_2357 [Candidatus Hydrogenedentes bacterium]|nr:hypothetical protein [Candidatus Hydrogenedentota bacterium]